jgi:hypothetical protein
MVSIIEFLQIYGMHSVFAIMFLWAGQLVIRYNQAKEKITKFNLLEFNQTEPGSLGEKFREICLNYDEYRSKKNPKLILKTEPNTYLINHVKDDFEKNYYYRSAGLFTGVALMITFLLIGSAVYHIGDELPKIDKNNLQLLGNPIKHLQEKFYVSVAGIACTVIYQMICALLVSRLAQFAHRELNLRAKVDYIVRESQDLLFQEQQATGAMVTSEAVMKIADHLADSETVAKNDRDEIKQLITDLKNIDVTVSSFAENVTTRLESFIDRSVGDKLTDLISAQNQSTERMATQISEVLSKSIGAEMEKVFKDLSSALPNIMSNGANDATSKMADAVTTASRSFEAVSKNMPVLVSQLSSMVSTMEQQQISSQRQSQDVNNDLLNAIRSATTQLGSQSQDSIAQQSAILASLQTSMAELSATANQSVSILQERMNENVGTFTNNIAQASTGISSSLQQVNSIISEFERANTNMRESNSQLLREFNNSIAELRNVSTSVAASNAGINTTLSTLLEINRSLIQSPNVTRELVVATSQALVNQKASIESMLESMTQKTEQSNAKLVDGYSRGVELIARAFIDKIGEIERHSQSIRDIYSTAGDVLGGSLGSIENLNDNLETLNQSIKNLRT